VTDGLAVLGGFVELALLLGVLAFFVLRRRNG
jgi:LPXTG-motif cell wall-anchored protein